MADAWTVYEHATGTEEAPTATHHFDGFEGAYSHLKACEAVAKIVRITGPNSATDEQRRMIVDAGGVPTFES